MASKTTWPEIVKKQNPEPTKALWTDLCDSWGQHQGQFIFCREKKGHGGAHRGFRDPQTKITWLP
jgi:hypothetical protein